jgi:hypothetical protein
VTRDLLRAAQELELARQNLREVPTPTRTDLDRLKAAEAGWDDAANRQVTS